jgi:phosphoenolpyruvate-protein kinase (PTS system EI component)
MRELGGVAASPGVALGPAQPLGAGALGPAAPRRADPWPVELARARDALVAAAAELVRAAGGLRERGHGEEAEIVEASALMAGDPALEGAVEVALRERGLTAGEAILAAAAAQADAIGAIDDAYLAARADDVRSVGRRAAQLAEREATDADADGADGAGVAAGAILLARDLGPADVAELDEDVGGIALAAGGPTAHAAIVARSLGLPMVVGVGEDLLAVAPGTELALDGDRGLVVVAPERRRAAEARARMQERLAARRRAAESAGLPAVTRDGRAVRVLVNAAGAAEARAGFAAGAEGIGLLRTELAFMDAHEWPGEDEHRRALAPVLDAVTGRLATVRVLDFGADKTPPFLDGTAERGIALLLRHPDALAAQLRAILAAGCDAELRVLLPLVESVEQVHAVRHALQDLGAPAGVRLGAMIETPAAARAARRIAAACDFISIGTNDLSHAALGTDRFGEGRAVAYHPLVLALIALTVRAAHEAGRSVEVCGEAASDPVAMPLLVGMGVDELSVGAARVAPVREWVRRLDAGEAGQLARDAATLAGAGAVAKLVRGTLAERLGEPGDAGGEALERAGRVGAVGLQP